MEEIKDSSHYFYARNGEVLKNLADLFEFINKADDNTFYYHCNNMKNDFANWVGDTLKMKELSAKMYASRTRDEMYDIVKEEMERPFEELKEKIAPEQLI